MVLYGLSGKWSGGGKDTCGEEREGEDKVYESMTQGSIYFEKT